MIVGALIFAVFSVVYGYVIYIVFDTNREVGVLEESVNIEARREEHLRSLKNVLLDTESERAKLNELFLADNNIVQFIERIERLGLLTGVSLDTRSVGIQKAGGDGDVYEWLKISVSVRGSWSELYHFLSLIENLPVAVFLDKARFNYSTGADVSEWGGTFDLRVAKQKESKQQGL